MKKILVIAAHPDDEVLGGGGTFIKHVLGGDIVYCLMLGQGALARADSSVAELNNLCKEAKDASSFMGFKETHFLDFPDNSFDTVNMLRIIKEVEKYLKNIRPDVVYTHFENDLNIDHGIVSQAVLTACRPCNPDCPRELYAFETLSSTEWQSKNQRQFTPNVYIDIENVIDAKIEAMKKYAAEIRQYPHPRSIEGIKILAQYRGLESGLHFAEAFCLIRKIQK